MKTALLAAAATVSAHHGEMSEHIAEFIVDNWWNQAVQVRG